mmetsp:Transcript_7828/g.13909  ORF Transcript_7828/g.13909 Transcript_7828/m.13909 type:complete len:260 (+) Transcript_7828:91-870(+)
MSSISSTGTPAATVQKVFGLLDRFFSRNRAAVIVFTVWITLFLKLWNTSPVSNDTLGASETELSDMQTVEPLDRASVLARAKSLPVGGKSGKKSVVLRRDMSREVEAKNCSADLIEEDPAAVLQRFLQSPAAQGMPEEDLRQAWQALSKLYGVRGLHKEALEAQKLAMPTLQEEVAAELGENDAILDQIFQEDCLDGNCEDPEGFLSFAQLSAGYLLKETSSPACAEAEVRQWLRAFGESEVYSAGQDPESVFNICPAA